MTDPLLERLKRAEEGSRELSDEVLLACGWAIKEVTFPVGTKFYNYCDETGRHVTTTGCGRPPAPDPTRSLGDCLRYVKPEGWELQLFERPNGWFCRLKRRHPYALVAWFERDRDEVLLVASPALALCIAALKARAEG